MERWYSRQAKPFHSSPSCTDASCFQRLDFLCLRPGVGWRCYSCVILHNHKNTHKPTKTVAKTAHTYTHVDMPIFHASFPFCSFLFHFSCDGNKTAAFHPSPRPLFARRRVGEMNTADATAIVSYLFIIDTVVIYIVHIQNTL